MFYISLDITSVTSSTTYESRSNCISVIYVPVLSFLCENNFSNC